MNRPVGELKRPSAGGWKIRLGAVFSFARNHRCKKTIPESPSPESMLADTSPGGRRRGRLYPSFAGTADSPGRDLRRERADSGPRAPGPLRPTARRGGVRRVGRPPRLPRAERLPQRPPPRGRRGRGDAGDVHPVGPACDASLREPDALAGWLHGVAHRTALRARRDASRRRACEARVKPAPTAGTATPPVEASWRELQELLDRELQRLPEKLRAPFVLCCLERRSKTEAARLLGWKAGTVSGRLDAARKLVRTRLARRGVSLSAVLCGLAVTGEAARASLPATLVSGAVTAALRFGGVTGAGPGGRLAGAMLRDAVADSRRVRRSACSWCWARLFGRTGGKLLHLRGAPPSSGTGRGRAAPVAACRAGDRAAGLTSFGDAAAGRLRSAGSGTKRFSATHALLTRRKFSWSPDGKAADRFPRQPGLTARPRRLCLWDAATGREVQIEFAARESSVMAAAFSPDGKYLAAMENRGVVLWDDRHGKELKNFADSRFMNRLWPFPRPTAGSRSPAVVRDTSSGSATSPRARRSRS